MSENDSATHEPDTNRRRGSASMILSLIAVGLVVIGALVTGLSRCGGRDDAAPTPAPTGGSSPTTGTDSQATGFALPEVDPFGRRVDIPNNAAGQPLPQTPILHRPTDPDWVTAAPAGTSGPGGWQRVYGVMVPFSTSDGPTTITGGVPSGWTHTPQGCALAAAWIGWQLNARPGDRSLRERATVTSAQDLATFDREKAAGRIPDFGPESLTRWLLASDAFRITTWQDDLCVVRLGTRYAPDAVGTARWLSIQAAMVWDRTTWRLRLADGGQPTQELVYSIAGWTTW